MDTMEQRVRQYIEDYGMICPGDTVVAGVSGGADSLCLFLLLQELAGKMDFCLQVVHVHHGLRAAAREDVEFVEKLCRRRKVPCTVIRADARAAAKQWGTGIEEAGRMLRYDAFRQVCDQLAQRGGEGRPEEKSFRIAVAHHREDQAETVLFHLCRGTDLRGARGMLPVNGRIIRPLLCESRSSIEAYLTERGFSWQEDETNTDTVYTRNYLRREILPRLEDGVHAAAAQKIAQFAAVCAEAEEYLAAATDRALARCRTVPAPADSLLLPRKHSCLYVLQLDSLLQEESCLQGRILYRCLTDSADTGPDIGTVHVDALRRLSRKKTDGQISMPGRVTVLRRSGKLFFCREMETDMPSSGKCVLENPDIGRGCPLSEEEYSVCLRDFDGSMSSIPRNEYTKWFDYDKIGALPVLRTRRPGDFMRMFSNADTQGGHGSPEPQRLRLQSGSRALPPDRKMITKKLARIMLDGKIPAGIRDRIVLPFMGKEVLWIPGLRMGDSCKVTPATTKILEIRWNPDRAFAQKHAERGERWRTELKR